MAVEAESGLRVLGVNILGKFLGAKDPNMKCVAGGWGRGGGAAASY